MAVMRRTVTSNLDAAEAALAAGDLDTAEAKVGVATSGVLLMRF